MQANEIMQHQLTFNNNEQSAHRHTQDLHPKSPGMGDARHMSQSTYGLYININLLNTSHFLGSFFLHPKTPGMGDAGHMLQSTCARVCLFAGSAVNIIVKNKNHDQRHQKTDQNCILKYLKRGKIGNRLALPQSHSHF